LKSPGYFRVIPCLLAGLLLAGCGAESRVVNFLDPPSHMDKPVAVIRISIVEDYIMGDVYARLDGSTSYDNQMRPLTYLWSLAEKPVRSQAALVAPASMITTFDFDWSGCYTVTLVVTNSAGVASDAAITRIPVINGPRGGQAPGYGDCAL